jgi:hypothetical protein
MHDKFVIQFWFKVVLLTLFAVLVHLSGMIKKCIHEMYYIPKSQKHFNTSILIMKI